MSDEGDDMGLLRPEAGGPGAIAQALAAGKVVRAHARALADEVVFRPDGRRDAASREERGLAVYDAGELRLLGRAPVADVAELRAVHVAKRTFPGAVIVERGPRGR